MRYFAQIAYKGTNYVGWQIQPNGLSVQQQINESISLILGTKIEVLGCGRTDTGVHASDFYLHFDFKGEFPHKFINRLNKVLPKDIVFYKIFATKPDAHARFDAIKRSYEYHLSFKKNPFKQDTLYHFSYNQELDFELMNEATSLLMNYKEFRPFCKTHSDAKTMKCNLSTCQWVKLSEHHWVFQVSSNRFLRGMVRLLVGMSINIGRKKILISEVKEAMDKQELLKQSYSVPAHGLFLTEVIYPPFCLD